MTVVSVTMKYHFMIGCRAPDHNLAGVVLIRVKMPRDRRTGSHFHDCINFYDVAFSAIFNRVMGMRLQIFEISGVRKLWQVRIH